MSSTMIKTQPSVMPSQKNFARVPEANIQRSVFNRDHGHKTTIDADYLYPILVDEIYPGDTLSCRLSAFCRMSTPLKPVMDNLFLDTFFFFVPDRLTWTNFQKFMGEQENPGDSTSYLWPQMTSPVGGPAVGSLSDYMGLPTAGQVGAGNTITFNSRWHRAYNLIWNQFFRDQNLQSSVVVDKDDGPDMYTDYVLLKRGKRHDYFTSCLPFAQKGTAVSLPLGDRAYVKINQFGGASNLNGKYLTVAGAAGADPLFGVSTLGTTSGATAFVGGDDANFYADLNSATAATVNALRLATQLQVLLETDARGGTRYIELNAAHFGVTSPDARLQRPEYLGGGSHTINFYPVAQSNATGATGTPQGNLAATGVSTLTGDGFTKSFTEHGVIIGLASIRADLNYQQGMHRMFTNRTKYDMYWPALAHIGEQAVLSREIYCDGSAADGDVFGYQERFAELRYKPSLVTGLLRSTAASTLDIWHAAEKFATRPTLGSTFIQSNVPSARLVAVPSEPDFLLDTFFKYTHARPLPVYSVPQLGGRF